MFDRKGNPGAQVAAVLARKPDAMKAAAVLTKRPERKEGAKK